MKHSNFIIFIFVAIMFYNVSAGADDVRLELSGEKPVGRVVSGEIIIEIEKGMIDSGALTTLNKKYGLLSIERLFSGTRKDRQTDIYVFKFSPGVNIKEIVSTYEKVEGVIYVEPNYTVSSLSKS